MSDAAPREQAGTETDAAGRGLRVPFSAPGSSRAPAELRARTSRRLLAGAVAAKLTLDLLFVCALAVYTRAVTFGPDFEGALEHADGRTARGWVSDLGGGSGDAVELQLYVDGRLAAAGYSDSPNTHGMAPGSRLGFDLDFGPLPAGEHEARVYAVRAGRGGARRTLRQVGAPLRFVSR